jgi:hypothetical protein
MRQKFNQEIFEQELKKFKMISEYTFITGDDKKPLILGDKALDEEEGDTSKDIESSAEDIASEIGLDDAGNDTGNDAGNDTGNDTENDAGNDALNFGDDTGNDTQNNPPLPQPNEEEEVEVDVTSIIKGSKEAKDSADRATKNTELLMQKLSDLERRLVNMSAISDKIEGLEKEMIKRNPTPVEKLEMRSLDSYPFNQKLSDYWSDKEGAYDVMDNKSKEYVLTKSDVDNTYNSPGVRDSFNLNENLYFEETINDFEEEDI